MNATRSCETHIIRHLLQRRAAPPRGRAARAIRSVAAVAAVLLLGLCLRELLWVLLAAAAVISLGLR